eukprot:CAMPEP_0179444740 /NCGR_PEP_ID=MMETSP0799-20121207/28155_1 /TAXON_ID=46947 /ORGANISM="Geminigera cryophila, Strain CCMP2564" /LENGTH=316 /DNA_ID=CAMNT_0021232023 /DNA_START=108 /DNA_END=1055 /DNA_ORIENTATION=-
MADGGHEDGAQQGDQEEGSCTECYLYGVLAALGGSTLQAFGLQLWKLHFLTQERAAEAAHLKKIELREARREQKRAARRLTNGQHTREYTFADHELGDHNGEITSAVSSDLGFPDSATSSPSTPSKRFNKTSAPSGIPAMILETSGLDVDDVDEYDDIPLQEVDGSWITGQNSSSLQGGTNSGFKTLHLSTDGVHIELDQSSNSAGKLDGHPALRKIRRGHHRRAYSDEIDLFRADIQKALVAEEMKSPRQSAQLRDKAHDDMAWQQHPASSGNMALENTHANSSMNSRVSMHRRCVSDQQDYVGDVDFSTTSSHR